MKRKVVCLSQEISQNLNRKEKKIMPRKIVWLVSVVLLLALAVRPAAAAETSQVIQFVPPCDASLAGLGTLPIRLRLFKDAAQPPFVLEETQPLTADANGCLSAANIVPVGTVLVGSATVGGIP